MLEFIRISFHFSSRRTHQELARNNPAEALYNTFDLQIGIESKFVHAQGSAALPMAALAHQIG